MKPTNRKPHSVYLHPDQHERFMKLRKATRISESELLREAVGDFLKKYAVLIDDESDEKPAP